MGLGFKYHVVTIAAIFFALAIGLVVGSLYASPRVPETMQTVIDALKRAQISLDQNNRDLKQERDTLQNALHQALPYALHDRLMGHTVAIIQSTDEPNIVTDLQEMLADAGAKVVSTTTIDRHFAQPDELLLPRLKELGQQRPHTPANRTELISALASLWKNGDSSSTPLMPVLQNANLLHFDEKSDFTHPVSTLILVTGNRTESSSMPDNVEIPLISALNQAGITVFACEPQATVDSNFPRYQRAHLTVHTIEKVDTDTGKWQLVMALGEK